MRAAHTWVDAVLPFHL
uniref:Uncharacterized protein n=1 Tax=Anguilla anguilla TaxID=7936 RepID=A0A0E9VSS6_ANGAN